MHDFLSLGISEATSNKLRQQGLTTPTPIQNKAIPMILDQKDVIAQAQTGTGKTLAFVLPILERIGLNDSNVQALIVTPTRELALQITDEIEKLISGVDGVDVLAVYGGQDVEKQLKKLRRNVQIVVGTPGRLLDHIRRKTIDLSHLRYLVLDEADQMLHIGFLDEVEDIIKQTPKSRQTMLFSATIPSEVKTLARKHMKNAEYIQVEKTQGPAQTVEQIGIHTVDRAKQSTLIQLIEAHRPFLAIIFCRTKRRVSKLYGALKSNGFKCDELHGDLSQAKREQVMKRFRDADIQLLVATDVAARGLDVEGVTHVYNYDIPEDSESYVHRIGRTGRAGTTGMAVTLYTSEDRPELDKIEKELNVRIDKQNLGNAQKALGITKEKEGGSEAKPKRTNYKGRKSKISSTPSNRSTKRTDESKTTRTEKKNESKNKTVIGRKNSDDKPKSRNRRESLTTRAGNAIERGKGTSTKSSGRKPNKGR